jgi:hypothetical protein
MLNSPLHAAEKRKNGSAAVEIQNAVDSGMNTNELLDAILDHMAQNPDEIPLRPDSIAKNAGLNIDRASAYLLCDKMFKDGYLHRDGDAYVILLEGVEFSKAGGYIQKAKKIDWIKVATWVAAVAGVISALAAVATLLLSLTRPAK